MGYLVLDATKAYPAKTRIKQETNAARRRAGLSGKIMLNIKQCSSRERQTLNPNKTKQENNKLNMVENVNPGNGYNKATKEIV
jgi:hypothetical protein